MVTDDVTGLSLLLVFRSDFIAQIGVRALPALTLGDNWRELGLYTLRQSKEFLTGGLEAIGEPL